MTYGYTVYNSRGEERASAWNMEGGSDCASLRDQAKIDLDLLAQSTCEYDYLEICSYRGVMDRLVAVSGGLIILKVTV